MTRFASAGTAFIASAFAVPALATLSGSGARFDFAPLMARALGWLLVLALVAWVVARRRSELVKAQARVVVGVLLCLALAGDIVNAADEAIPDRKSIEDAVAFQRGHAAKFDDMGKRFDHVNVTDYVTAARLASPRNVADGQGALARYRQLLDERRLLLQAYLSEYGAFLDTLPPGEARRGAESAIGPSKRVTEEFYRSLDRAQGAHADALAAIFSWAQANAGLLEPDGGRLRFGTREQQVAFSALAFRLHRAELAVMRAVDKAQVDGVGAAVRLERSLRQAAMSN